MFGGSRAKQENKVIFRFEIRFVEVQILFLYFCNYDIC